MNGLERFYSPPEIGAPGRSYGRRLRRELLLTGVFSIVMLAAFVFFVRMLSTFPGKTRVIETTCEISGGVRAGTPVMQDDYLIGSVTAIEPTQYGDSIAPPFKISMRINERWRLPDNPRFMIGSAGPLQGNVVKLDLNAMASAAPDEDEPAAAVKGLSCRIESSLVSELDEIAASVKTQIKALEEILVGSDAGFDQEKQQAASTLQDLSETVALFRAQMEAIRPEKIQQIVNSAESTATNVEKLTLTLTSRSREIEKSVNAFSDLAQQMKGLVEENRPRVDRSFRDTQYILQELANSMTPILNNLDETSRNLKEVSEDFRNRPVPTLFRSKPGSAGDTP